MKIIDIACICHQANKALCEELGDWTVCEELVDRPVDWLFTTTQHRESVIEGVKFCLSNPDAPPSANHESWYNHRAAKGWVYGEEKDEEKKTHPCMVPYGELPPQQQAKDLLFKSIVAALKPLLLGGPDSDWVESSPHMRHAVAALESIRHTGALDSEFERGLKELSATLSGGESWHYRYFHINSEKDGDYAAVCVQTEKFFASIAPLLSADTATKLERTLKHSLYEVNKGLQGSGFQEKLDEHTKGS